MERTFSYKLIEAARSRPGKTAMTWLSPREASSVSFGKVLAQTRSLAHRLIEEGIQPGDRIALLAENHPNWAIAYFGILHCGAVAVPLDPAASVDALAAFLDGSQARRVFVSGASLPKFRAACERLGRAIPAVMLTQPESSLATKNGWARFEDWAATPVPPAFELTPPRARPDDIAVLMYTSGTTGFPKAVPLTHANITAELLAVRQAMRIDENEIVLGLLPLFHVYSQIVTLWLAPVIGARVLYLAELNSAEIARGLKLAGVTALIGVPRVWYLFHKKIFDAARHRSRPARSLFRALLALNGVLRDGLGLNAGRFFFPQVHEAFGGRLRLAVSAGASFDVSVARDFHRLGFTLLQGYGLTETCGAATVTRFEDNRIGSVGTPLDGVEIRIDDPNGEGVGEVLIRGPIVTPGYYQNPDANREAFTADGWFRTGDLGRLDAGRHLFIVGRKKDVIKLPSGKNVFPEDVEAHYSRSPLISEMCVLGVRDAASGFARAEKLLGVVVPDFDYLKAHGIANAREAIRFDLDNRGRELPEYQRVRDYLLRAEPLPRTTTRKLQRFALQREIESAGGAAPADVRDFVFTAEDRARLAGDAGRAVAGALRRHLAEACDLHPGMNLELDLGLDSLARAEFLLDLEHALGRQLPAEQAAVALTIGELIDLTSAVGGAAKPATANHPQWPEILAATVREESDDLRPLLRRKPLTFQVARGLLRIIRFLARRLFGLRAEGLERLRDLPRPFLVCPNHQSYLDPILLCALYPPDLLRDIFHVGASEYFQRGFMRWLAQALNIIPIDADRNLMRAMRAGARGLQAGKILNIYPEGQRSFDGELQEFKDGAAILATELRLPIVPVAIDGAYRVWPRAARRLHLAPIRLRIGAPLDPARDLPPDLRSEDRYPTLTALLKQRIQSMLDDMRNPATRR